MQNVPIIWFSKQQNTVKASSFGSEIIMLWTAKDILACCILAIQASTTHVLRANQRSSQTCSVITIMLSRIQQSHSLRLQRSTMQGTTMLFVRQWLREYCTLGRNKQDVMTNLGDLFTTKVLTADGFGNRSVFSKSPSVDHHVVTVSNRYSCRWGDVVNSRHWLQRATNKDCLHSPVAGHRKRWSRIPLRWESQLGQFFDVWLTLNCAIICWLEGGHNKLGEVDVRNLRAALCSSYCEPLNEWMQRHPVNSGLDDSICGAWGSQINLRGGAGCSWLELQEWWTLPKSSQWCQWGRALTCLVDWKLVWYCSNKRSSCWTRWLNGQWSEQVVLLCQWLLQCAVVAKHILFSLIVFNLNNQ